MATRESVRVVTTLSMRSPGYVSRSIRVISSSHKAEFRSFGGKSYLSDLWDALNETFYGKVRGGLGDFS